MRDMGDVFVSGMKRRLYIGCLSAMVGLPCLGGLFWLIFNGFIPMAEGTDLASSPMLPILIVSGTTEICVAIFGVTMFFAVKRRASEWDEIFLPLGFTGRMYMINGRQYQRKDGNRMVSAFVYRGPTIELRITAPVDAEFRVFHKGSLPATVAGSLNNAGYVSDDPELESLVFYPVGSPWLPGFLQGRSAMQAISQLMKSGAEWAIFRRLELISGELILNLYRSREWNSFPVSSDEVRNWVRNLNSLADDLQASALPEGGIEAAAGRVVSRQGLDKTLMTVVMAIVIGMPVCMILVFLIAFLVLQNG
jgi:hypothetical protein